MHLPRHVSTAPSPAPQAFRVVVPISKWGLSSLNLGHTDLSILSLVLFTMQVTMGPVVWVVRRWVSRDEDCAHVNPHILCTHMPNTAHSCLFNNIPIKRHLQFVNQR